MKTNPNEPINPSECQMTNKGSTVRQYYIGDDVYQSAGLTKREHFAAMAMRGYVSEDTSGISHQSLAEWAVRMADALIEALNKEVSNG